MWQCVDIRPFKKTGAYSFRSRAVAWIPYPSTFLKKLGQEQMSFKVFFKMNNLIVCSSNWLFSKLFENILVLTKFCFSKSIGTGQKRSNQQRSRVAHWSSQPQFCSLKSSCWEGYTFKIKLSKTFCLAYYQ